MNSYYKKIDNCLNCDDANIKVGKLYEILCTNCNKKLLATKIADAEIPDWCPKLEDKVLMSKSDVIELQKYRKMLLDDLK